MRLDVLLIGALLLTPAAAFSDRTIVTPSGYTTPSGCDLELYQAVSQRPRTLSLFDASTSDVQFETAYLARPGLDRFSFSIQALVLPETFVTPALSIGIKDIGNSAGGFSEDGFYGRAYYLAVTKGLDNSLAPPKIHGVILTAGLGAGSYHGLFGGIGSDLPLGFKGTAEFDGRSMNYRLALPVAAIASLSLDRIGDSNYVAVDLHSSISL